jgi:uncharacterized protein YjbK
MSLTLKHPQDVGLWEMYKALNRDQRLLMRESFKLQKDTPFVKIELLIHEYWILYDMSLYDADQYARELGRDDR